MKQILVYADSLSWGLIPGTRERLAFKHRWPGVFEAEYNTENDPIRVIENCLNGRRTVWSDPFKAGRDGSQGLAQVIEMHSPLTLVIIMLGHNDFQNTHNNNAWLSAQGMVKLIQIIRQAPIEPGMPVPEILVIAPPLITQPKGSIAPKFMHAETRCIGLPHELKTVAYETSVHFFDANNLLECSKVDGIHLDKDQHFILGKAIAKSVAVILDKD